MPPFHSDAVSRRHFLHAGGATALATPHLSAQPNNTSCIFLVLTGGPSQLDTWDPKPNAPSDVRSPFRPIKTNVPGIHLTELFPRLARHADKFALLRTLHHSANTHDAAHQLMQTGRLFANGLEHPHHGSVIAKLTGSRHSLPAHVLLPHPLRSTGANLPYGQSAGFLGRDFDPALPTAHPAFDLRQEPHRLHDLYGRHRFGQSCLRARRLVEAGVRFVTVNMFDTVFDEATWDTHGAKPFSSLHDLRDHVAPAFDQAYAALLEDLHQRGRLASTLIVSTGEFGRAPRLNASGGRDHWSHCWTMLMAGGPIQGGQVIGSSNSLGAEPKDRPITPQQVAATVYQSLGIPLDTQLPGPHGPLPLVDPGTLPIHELFRS